MKLFWTWVLVRLLSFASASRLPAAALGLGLVAGGAWGAYALAAWYWERLAANAEWVDAAPVERASRLVGSLFERAVEKKLISLQAEPGRLRIRPPPCGERFSPVPRDPTEADPEWETLLELLCTTIQGREIAAEIQRWNVSFSFLAIRDDRGRGEPCADGAPAPLAYIETGCKPARWRARRLDQGGVLVEAPVGAYPPQREFAMIAAARRRGANDWLMVAPAVDFQPVEQQTYRLTTSLVLDEPITIDLIGRPSAIAVDGERRLFEAESAPQRIGPVSIAIERLCEQNAEGDDSACSQPPKPGSPHGLALTLRADGAGEIAFAIEAAPLRTVPRPFREGLRGQYNIRRSTHIEARCRGPELECELAWAPIVSVDARRPGRHAISTREGGASLVDESGRITADALDLGLAPVVGLGPQDSGSLTAALAAKGDGADRHVVLTIDRRMQTAAVEALAAAATCAPQDLQRGAKAACRIDPSRRAALVLMDADSNAGEILAMASWPPVEKGLNIWDVLALEAGASSRSPVAGHAWRATDRHNVPGSTFKVVTALAATEAALAGDADFSRLLAGMTDLQSAAEKLGLKHRPSQNGCAPIDPADAPIPAGRRRTRPTYDVLAVPNRDGSEFFCIQNSSDAPFSKARFEPSLDGCPPQTAGKAPQVGVCEALATSSNLWFAGAAMLLDGDKVVQMRNGRLVEIVKPLETLAIDKMADRLFPEDGLDLLRGQGPRAGRLIAEPIVVAAAEELPPGEPRRMRVALSGYGQAVNATALAVANVFASVASEQIARPRLVRRDPTRPEDSDPEEGRPLLLNGAPQARRTFLDLIRAGLAATASSRHGTAYREFHQPEPSPLLDERRLFVKTGTADVQDAGSPNPRIYSSWLAGWIEGVPTRGVRKRLAFACWKSHSREVGAEACGPIVRQVLETLDAGESAL